MTYQYIMFLIYKLIVFIHGRKRQDFSCCTKCIPQIQLKERSENVQFSLFVHSFI